MYAKKKYVICTSIILLSIIAYKIDQLEIALSFLSLFGIAYFFTIKRPMVGAFFSFIIACNSMFNIFEKNKKFYEQRLNIAKFINKYIPFIENIDENNCITSLLFIIMILYCILSIIYTFFNNRNSPIGISNNVTKEFINTPFKINFCKELVRKIDQLDKEYNWQDDLFVPLKADIEIKRENRNSKKVVDLLTALKKCHQKGSPVYLLLGDPGSGKSVALRKLSRDLLKDVDESGKIPLYINLKEWKKLSDIINNGELPTQKQLVEFIIDFFKNGDYGVDDGLDYNFRDYLEQGRWFFIFDSFDEIPCLLNLQEPEYVINHLSKLLYDFLSHHYCGGIVASRPYRSPVDSFRKNVILTIRPMDEDKINKFFSKYTKNSKRLLQNIYHQKTELYNILGNPFYASLILNYYTNQKKLPRGQTDMFNNFIDMRLNKCSKKLKKVKLTKHEIITNACLIANCMFETESGLEISIDILKAKLEPIVSVDNVIDILCYAKICRKSEGEDSNVTFVHRRFQEYFLVLYFSRNTDIEESFYNDIERNTRLHDALILYCEIINNEIAEKIAQHCWDIIRKNHWNYKNIRDKDTLYAINCMLFLKEAFINRRSCLHKFLKDFHTLLSEVLNTEMDMVCLVKIAECICLFNSNDLDSLLLKIFNKKHQWINEIALKSCVSFNKLNKKIEYCCFIYLTSLNNEEFLKKYYNLKFIFSIDKSFKIINIYMLTKIFDIIVSWLIYIFILTLTLNGKLWEMRFILIQDKMILFLIMYFVILFFLFKMQKDVLPRGLIIIYLIYSLPKMKFLYLVWFLIPIHKIFKFFRIGFTTDDDLDHIIERIELKNNDLLKESIEMIVLFILLMIKIEIPVIILGFILGRIPYIIDYLNISIELPQIEILFSYFYSILIIVCSVVIFAFIINKLLKGILNAVYYINDTFKFKEYIKNNAGLKIDRQDLENNLKNIRSKKLRSTYLDSLYERHVNLFGTWTNNYRPKFDDKNTDTLLAMLDIRDLNIKL